MAALGELEVLDIRHNRFSQIHNNLYSKDELDYEFSKEVDTIYVDTNIPMNSQSYLSHVMSVRSSVSFFFPFSHLPFFLSLP